MIRNTTRVLLIGSLALGLMLATTAPALGAWPGASSESAGLHIATAWGDGGPLATTPPDSHDPGDDEFTGLGVTTVTLPFTADRNLAWDGHAEHLDVDHYRLELTAGRTYRIRVQGIDLGSGPSDPFIDVGWVPDPVGAPDLLESYLELDNSRSDTTTADAYFTAPHTGTYYVWVQDAFYTYYYWNFGGSYRITISDVGPIAAGSVERIDGLAGYGVSDRYSVVAALAEKVAGSTQPTSVIIASGLDRAAADALTAGSLSGSLNAPILLVRGDGLWARRIPQATADYLLKLKNGPAQPIDFMIVGGPTSVPETLKSVILRYAPAGSRFVARYGGADRYVVAANVAAKVRSIAGTSTVFVTNGQVATYFYDSLAVSALSAKMRYPILLSKANVVPPATLAEAARYGKKVLVGDDGALWSEAFSALGMTRDYVTGDVTGGEWIGYFRGDTNNVYDRNYMARLIAEYGEDHAMASGSRIGLANKLMDALGGGAAMGRLGGTMVFTDVDMMDPELIEGWIITHRAAAAPAVTIAGGTASVEPGVEDRVSFLVGLAP